MKNTESNKYLKLIVGLNVIFVVAVFISFFKSYNQEPSAPEKVSEDNDTYSPTPHLQGLEILRKALESPESVRVLDLRNQGLSYLPSEIGLLINLEELYISSNFLESLPSEIGRLEQLEILKISNQKGFILSIPKEIGDLENLRILELDGCLISEIPESIGNLKHLEILNLDGVLLPELPETIGNLENLEILSLNDGALREVPETIGNLFNLKKLVVRHRLTTNEFEMKVPQSIKDLSALEELTLHNIDLEKLPENLEHLNNVKKVDFSRSKGDFPMMICSLDLIQDLNLTLCPDVKFIPREIANLKQLKSLTITRSENVYERECVEIRKYCHPLALSVNARNNPNYQRPSQCGNGSDRDLHNRIRTVCDRVYINTPFFLIPSEIQYLENLEILNIAGQLVDGIPVGILNLSNLRLLRLGSATRILENSEREQLNWHLPNCQINPPL